MRAIGLCAVRHPGWRASALLLVLRKCGPVRAFHASAMPLPPLRNIASGLPDSSTAPAPIMNAPASASGAGRSPSNTTAARIVSSGPLARASGYTTDKSPVR